LNNHRICTTISQKHWELLKKHVGKFETQKKTIELALESLENNSKQSITLSREDKFWMAHRTVNTACFIQKDALKMLMETADIEQFEEYVTRHKPIEYVIEYYFQKPLKECSLEEVIEGLVVSARLSHFFDTIDHTDDCDHYTLLFTHSLGLNASKINLMTFESMFKTYGVKVESVISGKTIFMRIFTNVASRKL
jgi:hypothetical protein